MSRSGAKKNKEEIFHEESDDEQEEGEIVSNEEEESEEEQPEQYEAGESHNKSQIQQQQQAEVYDSSEEDVERIQNQKRKRELLWKQREQEEQKMAGISEQDLLRKVFEDIERTNKRVMLLRKKNLKRMEDLEKVRMTQQPYLVANNIHYRGSTNEYPLITCDKTGKSLFHPNYSLRVSEMKLGDFIQKNIKEENTANYLNEVVKFENYAYQQRKKRRQNIE